MTISREKREGNAHAEPTDGTKAYHLSPVIGYTVAVNTDDGLALISMISSYP